MKTQAEVKLGDVGEVGGGGDFLVDGELVVDTDGVVMVGVEFVFGQENDSVAGFEVFTTQIHERKVFWIPDA